MEPVITVPRSFVIFLHKLILINSGIFTVYALLRRAPSENPIENIWGQAKKVLQQMHQRCRSRSVTKGQSFKLTNKLFELFIEYRLFTMPNLGTYEAFSTII
uniref:Transposase n=1 Tax=Moorena producens (strain JHB) TaxID=1454205 RepID=A0A1D9FXW5_MOOP1